MVNGVGDGDDTGGGGSAGGDEQFANGAYAQSARPWLNGTVVIEQGPWLVNFGKLVSNIGMSGEQVGAFLTYIRDWGTQTQEYLAENSSRGVTTWKTLRTHLEKMPNPSDKHEHTVRIDVPEIPEAKMAERTFQLR